MKAVRALCALIASSAMLLAFSTAAFAADASPDQLLVNAKNLRWSAAPPTLPKGAKIAVLYGNPGAAGHYVLRLMVPSKYKVPYHWHPQAENVTVLSGVLYLLDDPTLKAKYARTVKPGGFVHLPALARQSVFTQGRTVVQIEGEGPFDTLYANPEEDPQKWAQDKTYYFPSKYQKNEFDAPASDPVPSF